jgi:pyruvate-formate lyase-activating enzyme
MRVVFVNPPKTDRGRTEITPPLGLLRLATVAQRVGAESVLVDLNILWHLHPEMRESMYTAALKILIEAGGSVYAFSSMCVDSHVALELSRGLKVFDRNIVTVLGGVHFSSIAGEVTNMFPWIDFVIQGEGEISFEALLIALKQQNCSLNKIFTGMQTGATERPVPQPAYELIDFSVYFGLNSRRLVDFETARGCRFKCQFCYSPTHYSAVRDFDIRNVLDEISALKKLDIRRIAITDDNFLNWSDRALALCEAIRSNCSWLNWQCYATFPQINEQILAGLSSSGCDRIFCGIDAVGQLSQRTFRKAFLPNRERFEYKLAMLTEHGIRTTCAFLLCPPSHPGGADMEETVRAALIARLCGAEVRLNTLTLYNGTPARFGYGDSFAYDECKTQLLLDVPEPVAKNHFAALHSGLFPFHSRYVPATEWNSFIQLSHCLSSLVDTFPRTLNRLWEDNNISPIEIARRVLGITGDLCKLEQDLRREAEQEAAYSILRSVIKGMPQAKILESENPWEEWSAQPVL